jgi:hypothetical protein
MSADLEIFGRRLAKALMREQQLHVLPAAMGRAVTVVMSNELPIADSANRKDRRQRSRRHRHKPSNPKPQRRENWTIRPRTPKTEELDHQPRTPKDR